jgi:hypothetical protein
VTVLVTVLVAILAVLLAALAGAILLLLLAGLLPAALLLAGLLIALLLLTGPLIGVLVLIHSISFQRWIEACASMFPPTQTKTTPRRDIRSPGGNFQTRLRVPRGGLMTAANFIGSADHRRGTAASAA